APAAASSGKGEASWLAKWCTRKYAPSAPSSSAATASSMDCSRASAPVRVCEPGDCDQCPNERNPIFFIPHATPRTVQTSGGTGGRTSSAGAAAGGSTCRHVPDDVAAGPAPEAGVERRGPPAGDAPEGN